MEQEKFKNDRLPVDWKVVSLNDIGEIASGGTPSTKIPEFWNGEIPWITPADLSGYNKKYISRGKKNITFEGLQKSSAKLLPEGSILFSSRAPIGYVVIAKNKLATNQGFKNVIPSRYILSEYVYYYLKNSKKLAEDFASGTTFKEISAKNFARLPIPLPPLPEQRAIVARIEELFSRLDKGIETLQKVKEQLKVYRQAVLKWAFEGKLTEEWRKSKDAQSCVSTAEEMLQQIKTERERHYQQKLAEWQKAVEEWEASGKPGRKPPKPKKPKELPPLTEEQLARLPLLPKGWKWGKIIDLVLDPDNDIVDGPFGSNLKNSDYKDNGTVPVITISNIDEGFDKKIRYVTKEKFETIKRSAVYPGDIIVAKIGSSYGKVGVYPEWMPIGLIPANLLRIRSNLFIKKELLIYYLKSRIFKNELDKIMKSTAQPAFNVSKFRELPIPILPVSEQQAIVQEIETRLSIADKIEQIIYETLHKAEALRQSILKKAFEGKLLSEAEREALKNEPDWEPAEKLLERIKVEKEKLEKQNKSSRKRKSVTEV